jgi:plasmid replication initiation protein
MILSTTSTTDDTLTITMIATIQRWGDKDVTMELDFDKILNLA